VEIKLTPIIGMESSKIDLENEAKMIDHAHQSFNIIGPEYCSFEMDKVETINNYPMKEWERLDALKELIVSKNGTWVFFGNQVK